jgi:hypothetical protein
MRIPPVCRVGADDDRYGSTFLRVVAKHGEKAGRAHPSRSHLSCGGDSFWMGDPEVEPRRVMRAGSRLMVHVLIFRSPSLDHEDEALTSPHYLRIATSSGIARRRDEVTRSGDLPRSNRLCAVRRASPHSIFFMECGNPGGKTCHCLTSCGHMLRKISPCPYLGRPVHKAQNLRRPNFFSHHHNSHVIR